MTCINIENIITALLGVLLIFNKQARLNNKNVVIIMFILVAVSMKDIYNNGLENEQTEGFALNVTDKRVFDIIDLAKKANDATGASHMRDSNFEKVSGEYTKDRLNLSDVMVNKTAGFGNNVHDKGTLLSTGSVSVGGKLTSKKDTNVVGKYTGKGKFTAENAKTGKATFEKNLVVRNKITQDPKYPLIQSGADVFFVRPNLTIGYKGTTLYWKEGSSTRYPWLEFDIYFPQPFPQTPKVIVSFAGLGVMTAGSEQMSLRVYSASADSKKFVLRIEKFAKVEEPHADKLFAELKKYSSNTFGADDKTKTIDGHKGLYNFFKHIEEKVSKSYARDQAELVRQVGITWIAHL